MTIDSLILAGLVMGALGMLIWAGLGRTSSFALAFIAGLAMLASLGGAYYAAVETHSIPWTLGYGSVALAGAIACVRQVILAFRKQP